MSGRRVQVTSRDNHRLWFIRQGWSQARQFCAHCEEQVQMMTLEEAKAAAGVDLQKIHSLIETGELHASEITESKLLICLNSLLNLRARCSIKL